MDRRVFTASALAAALRAQDRIRIGFLGVSHSHAADKVRIARESPVWDLAGVCEDNPKVRAEYDKAGVRLRSRAELLADNTIAVIAVESDVPNHARDARMALEAGRHIHLEKPPSDNMKEFRDLVTLAGSKRLLMQMGYMWRYHPGINKSIEAARNGWLGEIHLVRGTMNTLIGADRRPEWALFHGGQMFEQGGHLIDPMVRLLGPPLNVTPVLKKHGRFEDNLRDNTVAVFEFPKALGVILSSVLQPGATRHRTFEILGSNGTAVVRPIEPATLEIDLVKAAGPYKAGIQKVDLPPFQRYVGDFEELARAVRTKQPLAVTPEQDLLVHDALLRASEMF
jgi:predicted dehydrogenase